MEVELTWIMGLWNGALEGQFLFKERGISDVWRSGEKILDMWANCVLKHRLSLKTFILNFEAFFVSLGIVISCIRKMSFSVTSAKWEFTPASHCFIIHLPGGGHCPLVRDSDPIRLLVIPTQSLSVGEKPSIFTSPHSRPGEYPGLFTSISVKNCSLGTDTEGNNYSKYLPSQWIDKENFSFKCSKIVKNTSYLKKRVHRHAWLL